MRGDGHLVTLHADHLRAEGFGDLTTQAVPLVGLPA